MDAMEIFKKKTFKNQIAMLHVQKMLVEKKILNEKVNTYLGSNESIIQDHVDGIVLACVWEPTCWLGWDNYNP